MWLSQLAKIEESTISINYDDIKKATDNSMDIGFKLFPLIDSISINLLGKPNGRSYLEKLGYSSKESNIIYTIFRNGILHAFNPYHFKYDNGEIIWGLMSSSGSSGFTPHYPGYIDEKNPEFNVPADKAFIYEKISEGIFHASLSLDRLVAQIKYDLTERQKHDVRKTINFVVGQKIQGKVPAI
jgi:hypothetical protein